MTSKKIVEKPVFSLGGLPIDRVNQTNKYVPDVTPKIFMPEDQERAVSLAITQNMPILLQGEAGTGKTSIARYVAHHRQQGYTRINMTGYATPDELIGSKSVKEGATYYEYGVLTKAMVEGHICVLDEINATPPDCLFILHGLLDDDRRITLPNGEIIRPHKDFRFFATMNPDYEGTKSLNRALIDRFPLIVAMNTLDPIQESMLLVDRCGTNQLIANKMIAVAQLSRKNYKDQKSLTYISTRTLLQWSELLKNNMPMKEAYLLSIVNKARYEERSAFLDFYGAVFKENVKATDEDNIIYITEAQKKRWENDTKDARNLASRLMDENNALKEYKQKYEEATPKITEIAKLEKELENNKKKLLKMEEILKLI